MRCARGITVRAPKIPNTGWIKRFILFHNKRHHSELGERDISAFLTHLAVEKHVSASTQNQALASILFLYKAVLERELDWLDDVLRAKDIDFGYCQLTIRCGKGNKGRVTMLPQSLLEPLRVKTLHAADLTEGFGHTHLPDALARKYPNADREWGWQFVFPSRIRSPDHYTGVVCRFFTSPSTFQRAIHCAARSARLAKRVSSHAHKSLNTLMCAMTLRPSACNS